MNIIETLDSEGTRSKKEHYNLILAEFIDVRTLTRDSRVILVKVARSVLHILNWLTEN